MDSAFLHAGTKCKAEHCGLYDFLPYKCQFCAGSYCSDHFRPAAHHCEKYVSEDRIAPPCPLCQTPISIKPDEDPNDAMEAHFNKSCAVMLGADAAAKSRTPRCSRNKCEKVLYTPITCDSCKKQFCATHRHPDSHRCTSHSSVTASPSPSKAATAAKGPRTDLSDRLRAGLTLGSSSSPNPSSSKSPSPIKTKAQAPSKSNASRNPGNSAGNGSSPSPGPASTGGSASTSTPKTPGHNPFSKVDRWVSPSPLNPPSSSVSSLHTSTAGTSISPEATMPSGSTTPLQAIIDSNAQKPKPHLLFSSFVPPSLFGTA